MNKPDEKRKKKREYDKIRYLEKRDEILSKNRKHNKEYYLKNRDKILNHHKAYNKEYYIINRDEILAKTKKRQKDNRDVIKIREDIWRKNNIKRVRDNKREWNLLNNVNEKARQKRFALKTEVMRHYSNGTSSCKNCKANDLDALCLDHINNDGTEHRKTVGQGVYFWAKKNNFPPILQVLCWNCNFLKSRPKIITKNQRSDAKMKERTLKAYSPELKCNSCPETNPMVLTIDHVNGNGKNHRKSIAGGSAGFYRWLRFNNFPSGYQVMCLNCNCKREINRIRCSK